ncbi:hypothetical protein KTR10_02085 [Candidatus Kaiserbacteria bacterium]|nr:hypothetical protein [Candidatus Kaiserbacteria bacterium]
MGELVLLKMREQWDIEMRLIDVCTTINHGKDVLLSLRPQFVRLADTEIPSDKFEQGLVGILSRYAKIKALSEEDTFLLLSHQRDFFEALVQN